MACISVTWCVSSNSIWLTQPAFVQNPLPFAPSEKKCGANTKKSRTCWDVSTKLWHVSVIHRCDRCHPTNCYKGGIFHVFQPLRLVGLLQLLATCTSPLLRCFILYKSCQYKVNLWRLLAFLLPVVSGKRWEGCYCDWWPLCPVASLWSQICFKIQIQMRQRERYDFDWHLGFMIRFHWLLPERKQYRRYVPILAIIWTNDTICIIRTSLVSFSTIALTYITRPHDIGEPKTYVYLCLLPFFPNGWDEDFCQKNWGHPNYTGLLALWNVHPELVDQNVTVTIQKICCVSSASSNHQHAVFRAIDDSNSAGCFDALPSTFTSQVLFFQHLSVSETLMFASSPKKG